MKKLIVTLIFFFSLFVVHAQYNTNALKEIGYENISELIIGNHYYIAYENNIYRYEGDALIKFIEIIKVPNNIQNITVLIRNRGIGISSMEFEKLNLDQLRSGKISSNIFSKKSIFSFNVDKLNKLFENSESANQSYLKGEIITGVGIEFELGNFDNSVRQKINFQPELISVIGKGAAISARYNIPTFNEIDNQKSYMQLARISQDIRFKDNIFFNLNFGFFTENRYGFTSRLDRYLGSEKIKLRFDFGLTKSINLDEKLDLVIRNNINTFNYSSSLIYRWNKYDTDFSYQYGTFISGDTGYKLKLSRQLDEIFVGLFINSTSFGKVAGFDFRIPLSTRRHMKNKGIRIRTKDFFYLPYNYIYGSNVANEYFTGSNILTQIQEYYPEVLRKKVAKHLYSNK